MRILFSKYCIGFYFALVALIACAPDPTTTPTVKPARAQTTELATRIPSTTTEQPSLKTTPAARPSANASDLQGQFLFAPGDGSIWIQDAASGTAQVVIPGSPTAFADAPAFSPNGSHLAYTLSSLTPQGTAQDTIHLIGTDGKNDRVLATPRDSKTAFNWPQFSPDGRWVYYTSSYPTPPNKEHTEIQRVPVGGGTPELVAQDARSAVISSNGSNMAFLRFNYDAFTASLWLADANGKSPKQLVADKLFAMIDAPHFSPDGSSILFAASGPPANKLPSASCEPRLLCALAQPVYANGLPWDLWLVNLDGSHFRQLTAIGADSPFPAWSRDGKTVAFFDTNGIYLVDVASHKLTQVSTNGGHGVFDWWSEP